MLLLRQNMYFSKIIYYGRVSNLMILAIKFPIYSLLFEQKIDMEQAYFDKMLVFFEREDTSANII